MLSQEHLTLRLTRLPGVEAWRQSPGLCFVFPKSGTGTCVCGRLSQRLAPGEVAVLGGNEPWKVGVADHGEMVFWEFSLKLEHLFPLFASEEIALLEGVVERLKGIRWYPASSALAAECHHLISELPPQFNLGHRSQLLRVAATLLSEEFKDAQPQRSGFVRIEEHLVQAFEKLSTEELLNLSVSELAERFGCSRRHLSRLFHQHFGLSVVGLRMEMRLLKAVSLLRDPNAKIIHVAEQSGFNHLGLFNTCFRKRFGTSPGRWRKLSLEAPSALAALAGTANFCPLHSNGFCPWLGEGRNGALAGSGHHGVLGRRPTPAPARSLAHKPSGREAGAGPEPKANRGTGADRGAPATTSVRCGPDSQLGS